MKRKMVIIVIVIFCVAISFFGYNQWANTQVVYEGTLIGQEEDPRFVASVSSYIIGNDIGYVKVIGVNPRHAMPLWVGNEYRIVVTKSGKLISAEPVGRAFYYGDVIDYSSLFED